jgi:hypothetical protein
MVPASQPRHHGLESYQIHDQVSSGFSTGLFQEADFSISNKKLQTKINLL